MRNVSTIFKEHRPNAVWRESFLYAKKDKLLATDVWRNAMSNNQPVIKHGEDNSLVSK